MRKARRNDLYSNYNLAAIDENVRVYESECL